MLQLMVLLAFVLIPAGGIALIYLVIKKASGGPPPSTDPSAPPPSRSGESVAWLLVIGGILALLFMYFIGSALAVP